MKMPLDVVRLLNSNLPPWSKFVWKTVGFDISRVLVSMEKKFHGYNFPVMETIQIANPCI